MNRFFFTLAKTWIGGVVLHWIFTYFSFAIPGEKLIETDTIIAFHHPSPSYPFHVLIVPKAKIRSLKNLPSDDKKFETDLFKAVNELVLRFGLDSFDYRLISNGGSAQDVDHLHFHLVSDEYRVDL